MVAVGADAARPASLLSANHFTAWAVRALTRIYRHFFTQIIYRHSQNIRVEQKSRWLLLSLWSGKKLRRKTLDTINTNPSLFNKYQYFFL